jgi:hypothetical protein
MEVENMDIVCPEAPANFKLTRLRGWPPLFEVKLEWEPVAGAVKYNIYVGNSWDDPDCAPNEVHKFELVDETADTAFVGTHLGSSGVMGLSIFYVTAVDANGNESPPSSKSYWSFPDHEGVAMRPKDHQMGDPAHGAPVITPSGGTFAGSVTVTISNIPPGRTALYTYTPNGDVRVVANPTPYTGPFTLTAPGTGILNVYLEGPNSAGNPTWVSAASFTIREIANVNLPTPFYN